VPSTQPVVPIVAVPAHLLGDVSTVQIWGGVVGLNAWLARDSAPGPAREHLPDVVAQTLPDLAFKKTPGVTLDRVTLSSQSAGSDGLLAVQLPAAVVSEADEPGETM
jgi:hypothetical protein